MLSVTLDYRGRKCKSGRYLNLSALVRRQDYRVEVLHPRAAEGFRDLFGGYYAGHRVAVAHWLPHCDDVRDEVLAVHLETPEMLPDPAEADLHFIGYEHAPCGADVAEKQKDGPMPSGRCESPPPPSEVQIIEH